MIQKYLKLKPAIKLRTKTTVSKYTHTFSNRSRKIFLQRQVKFKTGLEHAVTF